MALRFFIGNSGTGKTYQVNKRAMERVADNEGEKVVLLVPEQFTMQMQKELVLASKTGGIMNVDVLSFQRLAFRIFDEVGTTHRSVLDEKGKMFLIRKVLGEIESDLGIIGERKNNIGSILEIKSFLSEMIQYGITEETIEKLCGSDNLKSRTKAKLEDMKCVYAALKEYMKEKYIPSDELLDVLNDVLHQSKQLSNTTFVLDCFAGFTPQQKKVIEKLLVLSKDVWITITMDPKLAKCSSLEEYDLFRVSHEMMTGIRRLAKENQVEEMEPVLCGQNYRLEKNEALFALEQNLFRISPAQYEGEQDAVSIHILKKPLEEVKFAAQEIRRLVMKEGWRYRDIAIVTGDMSSYARYAARVFGQYDIPCFVDNKKSILSNPVLEFIRSVTALSVLDFSYEAVLRFLHCGLTNFDEKAIHLLDNYLVATGCRGKSHWSKEWTSRPRGTSEEELAVLNGYREQLMQELSGFAAVTASKQSTILEKNKELYHLFEIYQIQMKLMQFKNEFEEQKEFSYVQEYAQVFRLVIETLENMTELLGDEKEDAEEYLSLLEAGFAEVKIGMIPPGIDQVTIGDIERSRLNQMKALFFLGVNEGFVPKKVSDIGLFSFIEKETIKEQKVAMAPDSREQYFIQRFHLYRNLTKASERLYFSYSTNDAGGNLMAPSYLISTMQTIFPKMEAFEEDDGRIDTLVSESQGLEYLSNHWEDGNEEELTALFQWMKGRELYQNRLNNLMKASAREPRSMQISPKAAKALFGEMLEGSVTRLESYAGCEYAHFLQYGLYLCERDTFGFESLDFGNILHGILEEYARRLKDRGVTWSVLNLEEQKKLVKECMEKVLSDYGNKLLFQSAREKYMLDRIERIAVRTVWALTNQLAAGSFVLEEAEVTFETMQKVSDDISQAATLRLRGKIDRVDVFEEDDRLYVRVMDYKTGTQSFKLLKLFYGLQLQLVVYLGQAMEIEQRKRADKKVLPAGILYYHVDDPVIDKESEDSAEEIDRKLLRELRMDGLVSECSEVLKAFDSEAFGQNERTEEKETSPVQTESNIIRAGLKKDKTLTSTSQTITEKDLSLLVKYADKKIQQMGGQIVKGDIHLNPYNDGTYTACGYCPYHAVCSFNEKEGNTYRILDNKMTDGQILVKMQNECEGELNGNRVDERTEESH